MKILLTGAAGQLGRAFQEVAPGHVEVVPAYHTPPPHAPQALLLPLHEPHAIAPLVERIRPDWIVHAAAMTDVDACERNPTLAHTLNAEATGQLARAAAGLGARMAYVSTDYVFDGTRGNYHETDAPNPQSAYGRSKLEGERLARQALPNVLIARTSVVYGPHKRNFVTWALQELRAGRPMRIVQDQRVNPTLAHDLAEQLLALLETDAEGTYHTAGATSLSRLDMVHELAKTWGLPTDHVTAVRSDELNWLAPRPRDATLDLSKITRVKPPMTYPAALQRLKEMHP